MQGIILVQLPCFLFSIAHTLYKGKRATQAAQRVRFISSENFISHWMNEILQHNTKAAVEQNTSFSLYSAFGWWISQSEWWQDHRSLGLGLNHINYGIATDCWLIIDCHKLKNILPVNRRRDSGNSQHAPASQNNVVKRPVDEFNFSWEFLSFIDIWKTIVLNVQYHSFVVLISLKEHWRRTNINSYDLPNQATDDHWTLRWTLKSEPLQPLHNWHGQHPHIKQWLQRRWLLPTIIVSFSAVIASVTCGGRHRHGH